MSTNNRISDLVSSQLPFFVRDDHQTFIDFVEAYYEYLEQANTTLNLGKTTERLKNLQNYFDIDNTLDDFAEKLYEQYLNFLPKDSLANNDIIIKHAKDFYRAKGTEKALKFLLRILYNKEAEIYYPKRDILKASDGKWFIQKSLRVNNIKIDNVAAPTLQDLLNFVSTTILGNTSSSTAIVERIDRFNEIGTEINEIIITSDDGAFINGEEIFTTYDDESGVTHTITANVFGGIINSITVDHVGSNYSIGDLLIFENSTGSGANARISSVTTGNIRSLVVTESGAGFLVNTNLLITGGGGSGANAYVDAINDDETYHPNTYNIVISIINDEANTTIGNAVYSNLVAAANANTTLANSLNTFVYGPCGPIDTITIRTGGSGYASVPSVDAVANSRVKAIGVLGKMEVANGGLGYAVGDTIEFVSMYGIGANANVTNVQANGQIDGVRFQENAGFLIGGFGYRQSQLPTTNVATTTGDGNANVVVTAILGDGEAFILSTGNIGSIQSITLLSRGSGYETAPSINLQASGDGNANAYATVIAGVFTYPGRYINDDGHLDEFNFLQNPDYYQQYSYVVKISESIKNYRKVLREMGHPAGIKLFGEYITRDEGLTEGSITVNDAFTITFLPATWRLDNLANAISITRTDHGFVNANTVYLEFDSNTVANGDYSVGLVANANTFNVTYETSNANSTGSVLIGTVL